MAIQTEVLSQQRMPHSGSRLNPCCSEYLWRFHCLGMTIHSVSRAFLFIGGQSKLATPWTVQPTRLLCSWNFPGKNIGVGCRFLLQRIFPTQGSDPWIEPASLVSPALAGKFFTSGVTWRSLYTHVYKWHCISSQGCCNKIPQTQQHKTEIYFHRSLETS